MEIRCYKLGYKEFIFLDHTWLGVKVLQKFNKTWQQITFILIIWKHHVQFDQANASFPI